MASFTPPPRPEHVGILAMECYTPSKFVAQTALEVQDECVGKYTKGLGQDKVRSSFMVEAGEEAAAARAGAGSLAARGTVNAHNQPPSSRSPAPYVNNILTN
mmetsp:Transcript_104832/g.302427  ORF Transcript_104832/g.302427 Transcript_104832/m.302427 type:complete len:102 (-) Transcript_104832:2129-2434(-)